MPIYMCTLINKGLKFKFTVSMLILPLLFRNQHTSTYDFLSEFEIPVDQYTHTVRMMLYMTMYYIVMYNRISSFDSWLAPTFVIPPILYIQALLVILWAYPITNIWSTCRNTLPKIHESNFPDVEQILWSSAWRTIVANHPPTSHYSRLLPNLKGNQFPWL